MMSYSELSTIDLYAAEALHKPYFFSLLLLAEYVRITTSCIELQVESVDRISGNHIVPEATDHTPPQVDTSTSKIIKGKTNLSRTLKHPTHERVHTAQQISFSIPHMQRYCCLVNKWQAIFARRTGNYRFFAVLVSYIAEEGSQNTGSQPQPEKPKPKKSKTRKGSDKGSQEEKEIKTEGLVAVIQCFS